jgi:hypothetical protein
MMLEVGTASLNCECTGNACRTRKNALWLQCVNSSQFVLHFLPQCRVICIRITYVMAQYNVPASYSGSVWLKSRADNPFFFLLSSVTHLWLFVKNYIRPNQQFYSIAIISYSSFDAV